MATKIPSGITRQHLLDAIADIENGISHTFGESTGYDVLYEGHRYPPKVVVGLAAGKILGNPMTPYDFKGGLDSACFQVLEKHGFTIVPKDDTAIAESKTDTPWTENEIKSCVAAYMEMLGLELDGKPYVKSHYNAMLRETALTGRSKGSVELRMQNISSVLNDQDLPWIQGYKPRKNVGATQTVAISAALDACGWTPKSVIEPTDDEVLLKKNADILKKAVSLAKPPVGNQAPEPISHTSKGFKRSPEVVAYVLIRANGVCELCGNPAPFQTKDDEPFLEVHHINPLANGGADTVDNAAGLCPNCHRECHHGKARQEAQRRLDKKIRSLIPVASA